MKKKIHPPYTILKIKIAKDEFITRSTLKSDEILMDVDYRKHPAWNKSARNIINESNKNISNFNRKFSNLFLT